MAEQAASATAEAKEQKSGKYLSFFLAEEEYGLEILKVREIIGLLDITAVPRTPDFVKGVTNLRGKIVPVIDLRLKFSMLEAEHTERTCIIVVDVGDIEMGVIVDRVSEVMDIAESDIEPTPSFATDVNTDFIIGIAKTGGKVTILLDISQVLSPEEAVEIGSVAEGGPEEKDA